MEKLNERCLYHINQYLKPHDWVQVSQVSPLWKQATLKNWETITWILHVHFSDGFHEKEATVISGVQATEIVLRAAPYVKVLTTESSLDRKHQYIMFEKYFYRVENFKIETLLMLLIRNATNITTLCFNHLPKHSLVRQLFRKNNIRQVNVHDDKFEWYQNIQTHGVEELDIICGVPRNNFVSFNGVFPSLKKLTLTIVSEIGEPRRRMLSKILPYVPGLKYLDLEMTVRDDVRDSYTLFSDVTKLSELEELTLKIGILEIDSPELFFNQLPTCCPKLRVVKIHFFVDTEAEVTQNIFSLPQLECYECVTLKGFPLIDLPEMKHLTDLRVFVCLANPIYTGFFKVVKMIPRLENLRILFVKEVKEPSLVLLVCGVVKAATSIGKDVLITLLEGETKFKKLRITRSSTENPAETSENVSKTLELSFNFKHEKTMFKDVKEFVQNKLEGYQSFVGEK